MRCEKCEQDMETCACGRCGRTVLRLGRFCYLCGCCLEDGAGRNEASEMARLPEGKNVDDIDFRPASCAATGPVSVSSTIRGSARSAESRTSPRHRSPTYLLQPERRVPTR